MMGSSNGTALLRRHASDATAQLRLQSGDPIPGHPLRAVDAFPGIVYINEGGSVSTLAYVQDAVTRHALVTYDETGLHTVVASSDSAQPSGSTFGRSIALAGFNSSGDVAFTAPMLPLESPVVAAHPAMFIAPGGGTPVPIAGPDDPAADTGGTLDRISGVQRNNRGEVLFRAAIVGGTGGYGLFVAARDASGGVSLRKVVASGDPNPQGGTFDGALGLSAVRLNDAGQVAFDNNGELFVSAPGEPLTLVAAVDTPMPAIVPGPLQGQTVLSLTTLHSQSFNDAGQIAFLAKLNGPTLVVLRHRPGQDLEVIAYSGQQAPVTPAAGFNSPLLWVQINSAGDVAFHSALSPATGGQFKKPDGAPLEAAVLDGDPAQESIGGTYRFTGYAHPLDGGSVYLSRNSGVARWDPPASC